jgi:hypothetical protein
MDSEQKTKLKEKYGGSEKEYGIMDFGFDMYEMVNPTWAKLVFKLNNAGNLTIEAAPSLTPGVKPEGLEHGRVAKGSKIFDYEKKIIVSMLFADCLKIVDFAREVDINKSVKMYRNSARFSKVITLNYVEDNNRGAYAVISFDSTDGNGVNTKFKLPMNLDALAEFAQIHKSYIDCFHMIKYYTQVQSKIIDEIENMRTELKSIERRLPKPEYKNRYDVEEENTEQ